MNALGWMTVIVAAGSVGVGACGGSEETAAECGDGTCDPGETPVSCPVDCEQPRPPECLEQDGRVQAAVDESRVTPNAIVTVRNEECGTSVYASGDPADATPESLFLLASVTKTFVAASIMSLVGEGALDLDDPINNWITRLEPIYDPVTVRMLLTHTSGIYNFNEPYNGFWDHPDRVWTPEELVAFALSHPPDFAPGAAYRYSNTGYILLGLILEAIEGQSVGVILRQRAIAPAGLEHTFFQPEEDIVGQLATPFEVPSGDEKTNLMDPSSIWTAGGMVATSEDTARWVWELYGARSVIDSALVQRMIDEDIDADDEFPLETDVRYGLGTCITLLQGSPCGTAIGHNGRYDWSSTDAFYFPDCDLAIAVNQNALLHPASLGVEVVLTTVLGALFPSAR